MIEYLDWDSSFFQKKTGRIDLAHVYDVKCLASLLDKGRDEDYKLIYCFGDKNLFIPQDITRKYNGKLVDRKVIFHGSTSLYMPLSPDVKEYNDLHANKELIQLAYLSGQQSRFRLDSGFTTEEFCRMYEVWLEKSINKQIADNVFVYIKNNKVLGFVTIKKNIGYGQIGLIATDVRYQGLGIGRYLMNAVNKYLSDENIDNIEVATQLDNEAACRFYKKCLLSEKTINNIYHFWL